MANKGPKKRKKEQRREARKQIAQAIIEHHNSWSIRRQAPAEITATQQVRGHTSPVRPAGEMSQQHLFSGW